MIECKIVTFKNGKTMCISNEIAEHIAQRILSGTANDFQVFHNQDKQLIGIIRLSDVSFIESGYE